MCGTPVFACSASTAGHTAFLQLLTFALGSHSRSNLSSFICLWLHVNLLSCLFPFSMEANISGLVSSSLEHMLPQLLKAPSHLVSPQPSRQQAGVHICLLFPFVFKSTVVIPNSGSSWRWQKFETKPLKWNDSKWREHTCSCLVQGPPMLTKGQKSRQTKWPWKTETFPKWEAVQPGVNNAFEKAAD